MRILHVIGGMNPGGVETWLVHVLRHIDRRRFQMDFLVHTAKPCAYDDEVRTLGGQLLPCLHPSRPLAYALNFRRILREHGPYAVIHSHVHHFSGVVLRMAQQAGVPVRIAHSHNDTSAAQAAARLPRRLYLALTAHWIIKHATAGLACSRAAASVLFGPSWYSDPRWKVLYCGIDPAPFASAPDRFRLRGELGIPRDAFVVGHVGRYVEQKNHAFLLDVAAEVIKRDPSTHFLLVGDGPLRPRIEAKARDLGLERHIIFAGIRSDVPRLMVGAMDAFCFPSLYEGLPLALLEAQAAGLPCVCSEAVPEDAHIVKGLVHRLSVLTAASSWAQTVLAVGRADIPVDSRTALRLIEDSPFAIRRSVELLLRYYDAQHP